MTCLLTFRYTPDGTKEYVSKTKHSITGTTLEILPQLVESSISGRMETVFVKGDSVPEDQSLVRQVHRYIDQ